MIWHILKKDLKLLWPLVLLVVALHIMNAAMWFALGNFAEPKSLRNIATFFIIAVLLGVIALIVAVVHQDLLPGDRQDWLVRPIRRRDLVLAKLLFILIAVHGPMFLVDVVQCMATGFPFWDSLSATLSRSIYLLLSISLPVLALAAMTSNLIEVIGAILAICITLIVFVIVVQDGTAGGGTTFATMTNGQLLLEFWSAVALVTAVALIPLQYFRRATMRSRFISVGVLVALIPVSASIPWSSAFAFEKWLSPDPAAAKAIVIAFEPTLQKIILKPGAPSPANSVWLPLRVSGLGPESVMLNDRTYVRIIGRDGAILFSGLSTGASLTTSNSGVVPSPLGIDDFPVRTMARGDVRIHQFIILPGKIYDLVRSQPVRMEMDYSLTLFRIAVSDRIAALNGDKRIESLGLCKTKIDDDGDGVEIGCIKTGEPINCGVFSLENPVNGERNPAYNFCNKFYLPYNAHFAPNAMDNFGGELKFRDLQGLAKFPVDSSQLLSAQITLKTYQPVAHFTRHLTIPEISLGDWEAGMPTTAPNTGSAQK